MEPSITLKIVLTSSSWDSAALVVCAQRGEPWEEDLFIVRAVLQTLVAGHGHDKVTDAESLLGAYEPQSLPDTPLIHFIKFLIEVGKESCWAVR